MNPLENMNRALAYLEEHLDQDVDLSEAARRADCSEFHFKRMFSSLAGIGIAEYLRRRRLSQAAVDLRAARVLEVAVKYGYTSADAFARAFQALHGVTPSQARQPDQPLKVFPRLTFQLTVSGGTEMNYRIVEREPFRIVGLGRQIPLIYHGANPHIVKMWKSLSEHQRQQLIELSNQEPSGLINATTNFSENRQENSMIDHYVGCATSQPCPPGWDALEVAAGTWAVFHADGPVPEVLQNVWGRIYSEWFPSSGFQQREGPELCWSDYASRSQIWIPVSPAGSVGRSG